MTWRSQPGKTNTGTINMLVPSIIKDNVQRFKENIQSVEAEEVFNNFSWDVVENPVFAPTGQQIPGYKTIERSDNGLILNMCKETYTPTTNEEFSGFVHRLSDMTGYEIQNFDEFQKGAKVLAFLKAPVTSINGWKSNNYLAVGNAHDSSKAFFVANTSMMIRCKNQFSLASKGLKAFHTSNNSAQIRNIERSLKVWDSNQQLLQNNFTKLISQTATRQRAESFFRHMFDVPEEITWDNADEKLSGRKLNQIGDLMECIETESKDLGTNDFALFHGVTRWTTHVRNQKEKTFGNLFGTNADLNQKALTFLLN